MPRRQPQPFNAFQTAAKVNYGGGDYAHMETLKEVEHDAGDTLFLFIMRELGDEGQWKMDKETAIQRMEAALRDVSTVIAAVEKL